MSEKRIYVEGGGTSNALHIRCREGFHKLLENAGFAGRLPRITPCGGRDDTFSAFCTGHTSGKYDYVALLVDSEDPVSDSEKPWAHLTDRDGWQRPNKASDEQVFLMTACMETWFVADRTSFIEVYGATLQESALPPLTNLEVRDRHAVQDALVHASRNCTNAYAKNKRSFALLAVVKPETLQVHLPAFARMIRILGECL